MAALAQSLPSSGWYRRRVSEGTKGPIEYAFARKRVTLCKDDLPERTVWLVIKRTLGAHPTYAFSISNAPESAPLRLFVWLSGIRWAVEQSFEETKTELGMAHYEVRKYPGWHHHMLTSMLAHFFLWHLKLRLGKKSPSADGVAGAACYWQWSYPYARIRLKRPSRWWRGSSSAITGPICRTESVVKWMEDRS